MRKTGWPRGAGFLVVGAVAFGLPWSVPPTANAADLGYHRHRHHHLIVEDPGLAVPLGYAYGGYGNGDGPGWDRDGVGPGYGPGYAPGYGYIPTGRPSYGLDPVD